MQEIVYSQADRAWFNAQVPMSPKRQALHDVLAHTHAIAQERINCREISELHPCEVDFVADCARVVAERKRREEVERAEQVRMAEQAMKRRRRQEIRKCAVEVGLWAICLAAVLATVFMRAR